MHKRTKAELERETAAATSVDLVPVATAAKDAIDAMLDAVVARDLDLANRCPTEWLALCNAYDALAMAIENTKQARPAPTLTDSITRCPKDPQARP